MVNHSWVGMASWEPDRSVIMATLRIFMFIMVLLVISGCASELINQSNGIDTEEWCLEDGDMPWSGCWKEIRQIDCESGDIFEAEDKIGELRLLPNGRYSITWHPFETYTDYAGTYNINPAEGAIAFNHEDDAVFDGDGFYSFKENGDLELMDIWFGTFYKDSESDSEIVSCGYVFRKK